MMNKAGKGMHILKVCKFYRLTTHQLDFVFNSFIVSIFTFATHSRIEEELRTARTKVRLTNLPIMYRKIVIQGTDEILKK